MKQSIIRLLFFSLLSLFSYSSMAQKDYLPALVLSFTPAPHDTLPNDYENADYYSIYLTEQYGQELSDIQLAVLRDSTVVSNYFFIGPPRFWNEELYQYTTLDECEDTREEYILEDRYEYTANTLAVIVFDNGTNREVLVLPRDQEVDISLFYNDWTEPGTGWGEDTNYNTPVAIGSVEEPDYSVQVRNGNIVVNGAQGQAVEVYDVMGHRIHASVSTSEEVSIKVPNTGVFVVRLNRQLKRVFVGRQ